MIFLSTFSLECFGGIYTETTFDFCADFEMDLPSSLSDFIWETVEYDEDFEL